MGLRTDWGLIVLNIAEVLPMVADMYPEFWTHEKLN